MAVVNQRKLMDRITELVMDGYLLRGQVPNTIILTGKGLQSLMAMADRPINKSKLTKTTLAFERENTRKKAEEK